MSITCTIISPKVKARRSAWNYPTCAGLKCLCYTSPKVLRVEYFHEAIAPANGKIDVKGHQFHACMLNPVDSEWQSKYPL
jgi:hypothetical protein